MLRGHGESADQLMASVSILLERGGSAHPVMVSEMRLVRAFRLVALLMASPLVQELFPFPGLVATAQPVFPLVFLMDLLGQRDP